MPHPAHVIEAQALAAVVGTPTCPHIVDVRRQQAFQTADSMIAGAVWRDHRLVEDWHDAMAGDIVVYCVHGQQVSQSVMSLLRSRGRSVRYLAGGFDAYVAAGGTTVAKADDLPRADTVPTRWVTRERPKIDRMACPWFIRRFIDPVAEILYVEADWVREVAREAGAVPFDIPDTDFSHDGPFCSFDAFLSRYGIGDKALLHLARIVRGADTACLDLEPECAGLKAISLGLSSAHDDDHVTLAHAMVLYDALYAWTRNAADETHNWPARSQAG